MGSDTAPGSTMGSDAAPGSACTADKMRALECCHKADRPPVTCYMRTELLSNSEGEGEALLDVISNFGFRIRVEEGNATTWVRDM